MLSHFCKALLQMFYFQDLREEENPRIFIVTSLTKNWLMITPTKLTILLQFLKWQKFCEGILRQWKFNGSVDDFKIPESLATLLEWVLVGPSPSFTNESI